MNPEYSALQGRNNEALRSLFRPCRALITGQLENPGRCPGLVCSGTFGAAASQFPFRAGLRMTTYTHIYRQGYGSPEVDHTMPRVVGAVPSADGLQVRLKVDGLVQGHVHDFDLSHVRNAEDNPLVHANACYTLNDIPHN